MKMKNEPKPVGVGLWVWMFVRECVCVIWLNVTAVKKLRYILIKIIFKAVYY